MARFDQEPESAEQPTDEQLVRAFQSGDEAAFTEFAQRHAASCYRLALVWLDDGDVAADACQEVLLRSYTGFARFRFRAQAKTWLYRVLRNVCREMNRRSRRLDARSPERMQQLVEFAGAEPAHLEQLGENVLSVGVATSMTSALRLLPQRQREVVGLRLLQELSVADAAQVLGMRPGTVKANLHKAIANLRKHIGAQDMTLSDWLEQIDHG